MTLFSAQSACDHYFSFERAIQDYIYFSHKEKLVQNGLLIVLYFLNWQRKKTNAISSDFIQSKLTSKDSKCL
jgi:hypothetical protein